MTNPVVTFRGIESNHINTGRLERTIRLVPNGEAYGVRSSSYGELLNALCDAGVVPEEVHGIFKVSANDHPYSILLSNLEAVDKVIAIKQIKAGKVTLDIMKMSEQIVNLRIHWLPIYYDHTILKAIFTDYGEVLDIKMMKTSHEKLVALNGIREVKIKTDELRKQQIPHLVNFNSGQSILITMAGRPPYCLKCQSVGHVRARCPPGMKSFAELFSDRVNNSASPDVPTPPGASESSVGASSGSQDPADAPKAATSGTGDSVTGGPGSEQQRVADIDMSNEEDGSSKRGREDADDDYITPNRPVKARSWSEDSVPIRNSYTPIYGVGDIMNDDTLPLDPDPFQ